MSSDGVQITIPDFDDDEFSSTPIFGRSHGGSLWGTSSSGLDSPTIITPLALPERAEKSYFHSRGDSVTSQDSASSLQYTNAVRKSKPPFAHSTQSSVATTSSSPFTKKTSFASLRNAFKSTKSNDNIPPPMPPLDHQAYPVLKNPFNRSTSSLAQLPPMSHRHTTMNASPHISVHLHPSQHSHSGSIFHSSDNGSDHGFPHALSSSPPPVPPVPNAFGAYAQQDDFGSLSDLEDKVVIDPRTPSDYALHAIFIRFAGSAESHIDEFLSQPVDQDVRLVDFMGPGMDEKLDDLLLSLGKIAQKHAKPVVDSVMRWRKSQNDQNDAVSSDIIRHHLSQSPAATQSISKDGLGEAVGHKLEELTFEQFRRPDVKMLTQSANHRSNADLFASILGNLSNVRFESVTDRFLAELSPIAAGQVPKDGDFKYENLVKGLKHVHIKVWPPEAFEEDAEFLASLSKSFENAHGHRLKTTFAETLVHMMHPIGKTAQAEVNHPDWAKAIEVIYPKARDMMSKPRYWHVAYPLAVTALCVAPHEYFLRNWSACFEAGLSKLKEKQYRIPVLNGIMRLLWTYLYRCHEPTSTATTKLDSVLKHFFPSNRLTIMPQEDHLEPFIYIVHFVLSRHFDYGSEFCLELLQERSINSSSSSIANILAPERMTIALQALLLSLRATEREEPAPAWPSSSDFTSIPSWEDYPSSSEPIAPSLVLKPGWKDLLERSTSCLKVLAGSCYQTVGKWSIFDDQWSTSRISPTYEDAHNYVIRHHLEGSVAYPNQFVPQITVLQMIYQSWPRCLAPSLAIEDVFDMLIRGVIHIEPGVGEAATQALHRFMSDSAHASALLARFSCFPVRSCLHRALIDRWIHDILQKDAETWEMEGNEDISARINEIEAGALFLLAHCKTPMYTVGVRAIRMLKLVTNHLQRRPSTPSPDQREIPHRLIDALHGRVAFNEYLTALQDTLEPEEIARLDQWKQSFREDTLLRLADSESAIDRSLWRNIFPIFVQSHLDRSQLAIFAFREKLIAAANRYHHVILQLSGVSNKVPLNLPQRTGSLGEKEGVKLVNDNKDTVLQWHAWMKIISATAEVSEARQPPNALRDHSRARSEIDLDREQMGTTRDLFKYFGRFLDSDYSVFRDAAVSCISAFPAHGYSHLLEDLSILASRQFYDESRTKNVTAPVVGRARRQERAALSGKQTALAHVLKYIRNMQSFLGSPEHRDLFSLQRLRRYFCGTVERLFDGLATLKDSDRFIPPNMHLVLYRLCEEWCQLGKQSDSVKKRLVLSRLWRRKTRALSHAAIGAMAALCHKAFFPPDISSASPTDRHMLDYVKPLQVSPTLDRITAILASFHEPVQVAGKKALRSLLAHDTCDGIFLDEVLRRAFVTTRELDTSNARFFEAVADVICNGTGHAFSFSQIVCLGLSNLCHPLLEIRRQAFNMLEVIHEQTSGIISMVQYEAAVGSAAPSAYLHAHRLISDVLAGEHPDHAIKVLAQFADWIPRVFDNRAERGPLLLLQSLEYWVPNIDLMTDDKSGLSKEGRSTIYHLMALTSRYAESHAEQVLVLWTRLVDAPNQSNGHAAIRFLLEQSHKVGSAVFISCAAKVVACLSQSVIGRQMFEELCSIIEPVRMLPTIEHRLAHPDAEDIELWSDLDILFSEQPRLSLGVAQFALLFLSEVALERYWEFQQQLPNLLHALFMHVDHRQAFVQQRSRHMIFQVLRSCVSGYDELPDRSLHKTRYELKSAILGLEREAETQLWTEDDSGEQALPKMKWFGMEILNLLEPLHPTLCREWGSLALTWGTVCSIRPDDLGKLLSRLASTIAEDDLSISNFSIEIILTVTALASSGNLDNSQTAQVFWCAVACLSTTVENEYLHILKLLDAVLTRLDLNDPDIVELLLARRPVNWRGAASLQPCLLTGMRSSLTSGITFKLLQRLTRIDDDRVIDPTEGRVRDLYTLSLPWCLHAMSSESQDESLQEFALNIGRLAGQEERPSIDRIMTSFAKGRFRTRDDFLRQSVASLREHYGVDHWAEVITLLTGLVLNSERWLRIHTMQILKVLFQQRETKNPMDLLGSELLMPLLRLLETDLASQALDVLDEPMQICGGPPARHVLRMSLHHHLGPDTKEVDAIAEVFGIPQASGWCVPQPNSLRDICRANAGSVFGFGQGNSRPSRIDFQPDEVASLLNRPLEDDLGDMVQNLHELSSYFQEDHSSGSLPTRQLEARVAAILAKSADTMDTPQTPFVDVFDVGNLTPYEDSDASDSDSGSDLFEFDPPPVIRSTAIHSH
ncbi:Cell morphogenesis protein PAG1 [Grifola frondosa]|uniref:Cell morphogenesis protein PAG1 n=1 Tax=Grifola frondosa TaxID=5627 RepID=A0A1C7MMT6_GRIFR|nr:Cell morphogenesis protein PAG1 [Grifola frondosa]